MESKFTISAMRESGKYCWRPSFLPTIRLFSFGHSLEATPTVPSTIFRPHNELNILLAVCEFHNCSSGHVSDGLITVSPRTSPSCFRRRINSRTGVLLTPNCKVSFPSTSLVPGDNETLYDHVSNYFISLLIYRFVLVNRHFHALLPSETNRNIPQDIAI
jgi:hypothetical protein